MKTKTCIDRIPILKEISRPKMLARDAYGKRLVSQILSNPVSNQQIKWTFFEYKDWSMIMPITQDGQVITVSQYRPGYKKVMIELPAGGIEFGEKPKAAAKRELAEETGFVPTRIKQLAKALPILPADSKIRFSCFIGLNCQKKFEIQPSANEIIEVKLIKLKTWIDMVFNLQVKEPVSLITTFLALSVLLDYFPAEGLFI